DDLPLDGVEEEAEVADQGVLALEGADAQVADGDRRQRPAALGAVLLGHLHLPAEAVSLGLFGGREADVTEGDDRQVQLVGKDHGGVLLGSRATLDLLYQECTVSATRFQICTK